MSWMTLHGLPTFLFLFLVSLVTVKAYPSNYAVRWNNDCPWNDIEFVWLSHDDCFTRCNQNSRCNAMALYLDWGSRYGCWLKTTGANFYWTSNRHCVIKTGPVLPSIPSRYTNLGAVDCWGNDIKYVNVPHQNCFDECDRTSGCNAMALYLDGGSTWGCWLKTFAGNFGGNSNRRCISRNLVVPNNYDIIYNQDCPWNDIAYLGGISHQECIRRCDSTAGCNAIALYLDGNYKGNCWLKTTAANFYSTSNRHCLRRKGPILPTTASNYRDVGAVDCWGNDIRYASVSHSQCFSECDRTSGCNAIALYLDNYSTSGCWLKSFAANFGSNTNRRCYTKNVVIPSQYEVFWNQDCPYNDIQEIQSISHQDCISRCDNTAGCNAIALYLDGGTNGRCWIKTKGINLGGNSNRHCLRRRGPYLPTIPSTYRDVGAVDCSGNDIKYADISHSQCFSECDRTSGCTAMALYLDNFSTRGCWLKKYAGSTSGNSNRRCITKNIVVPSTYELVSNQDCPYNDIQEIQAISHQDCISRCDSTTGCNAIALYLDGGVNSRCWLKTKAANWYNTNNRHCLRRKITTPAAPSITASSVSSARSVYMSWSAPNNGGGAISAYKVYVNNNFLQSLGSTTFSFTFSNLDGGTAYTLAVAAVNAAGEGSKGSTTVTAADSPLAPTVSNTVGRPSATQITLSWSAPNSRGSAITGYKYYNGNNEVGSGSSGANSYTFTSLTAGVSYTLAIAAVNAMGIGTRTSNSYLAASSPAAPSVSSTVTRPSSTSIAISWSAPTANGCNVIQYKLYQGSSLVYTSPNANTLSYQFNNLVSGTTYELGVVAVNCIGDGTKGSVFAVAAAPPAAPSISSTIGRPSTTSITLTWTAPNANGSPITGYRVYNGANKVADYNANALSHTFTSLTTGATVALSVSAVNAINEGNKATSNVLVGTAPSAPTVSTSVDHPTSTSVTVSWTKPTNENGSPVNGYVAYNGNTLVKKLVATATSFTFESLTAGSTYSFAISATNSISESGKSTVTAVSAAVPSVPAVSRTVTRSSFTSITISWTASTANGAAIKEYQLFQGTSLIKSVAATVTSYTFGSLSTGTTYDFFVMAVNSIGNSDKGKVSALAGGVPDAPTISTTIGHPTTNSISISWTAPAVTNGAVVTAYKIYNGNSMVKEVQASGSLKYTVDQLTMGSTYTLGVSAVNSIGEGTKATTTAVAATAPAVPSVSQTVTRPSSTSIVVSWSAASANGSPVTNYKVYQGDKLINTVSNTVLLYTFGSLTTGTSYDFYVAAVNNIGQGDKGKVTALSGAAPASPQLSSTVGRPSTTSVSLSWTAPSNLNGAAITNYQVYNGNTMLKKVEANILTHTFTSLTMGSTYSLAVTAISSLGESNPVSVSVVAGTAPSAPAISSTISRPSTTSVGLTWSAATPNGAEVTNYKVYNGNNLVATLNKNALSYTFNQLTTGTTYILAVSAVNPIGEGLKSTFTVIAGTAPSSPRLSSTIGRPATTQLTISWTEPESNNGSPIVSYKLYNGASLIKTVNHKNSSFTFDALSAGSTYTLAVTAVSSIGESRQATVTTIAAMLPSAPAVSSNVERPSATELRITWTASNANGAAISNYKLYRDDVEVITVAGNVLTYTYKTLTTGTTYRLTVSAVNGAGEGAKSTAVSAIAALFPTAPVIRTTIENPSSTSVKISWTAPSSPGSAILSYKMYVGSKEIATIGGELLTYTFTNLVAGTTSDFSIAAVNGVGMGSKATISALAATPPGSPTLSSSVERPSSADVTISWTKPTSNGGSPITAYKLFRNDTLITSVSTTTFKYNFASLKPGNTYNFAVAAVNVQGDSTKASIITIAAGVPAAPVIMDEGHPIATTINLTWAADANNGAPITSYKVYRDNNYLAELKQLDKLVYTFTGLTAQQIYTLSISAVNVIGESQKVSVVAQAALGAVPPCNFLSLGQADCTGNDLSWNPTWSHSQCFAQCNTASCKGVVLSTAKGSSVGCWLKSAAGTATATTGRRCFNRILTGPAITNTTVMIPNCTTLELSWVKPTSVGCASTSYKVYRDNAFVATLGEDKFVYKFYGLTPGKVYSLAVSAVSSIAEGAAATVQATPAEAPAAPTLTFKQRPNTTSIMVEWIAPDNKGAAITAYKLYQAGSLMRTTDAKARTYTFNTLTPGSTYEFAIAAVNSIGSSKQQTVTVLAGGAPSIATVSSTVTRPVSSQLVITWSAPSTTNGPPLLNYKLYRDGTLLETLESSMTTYTFRTLTPGTVYNLAVSAVNAIGESVQSSVNALAAFTPLAPTLSSTITRPSSTKISVTWTAPNANGSPIKQYKAYNGSRLVTTVDKTAVSYTFINLLAGTTYDLGISAVNDIGESTVAYVSALAAGVPSVVSVAQNVSRPTTTSITIIWTEPANFGSVITKYFIYRGSSLVATLDKNSLSYTFLNLATGTSYELGVIAANSIGNSTMGKVTALAGAAPSRPNLSTAVGRPSTTNLTISWMAPNSTNGAAITNYKLYNGNTLVATVLATQTTYNFGRLTAGTTYTLAVSAVNSIGEGSISTLSALCGTATSAPTVAQTVTRPTATSITVSWTKPSSENGSPVSSYKLYNGDKLIETVDHTVLAYTFRTLTAGTTYTFSVVAVNAIGDSSKASVTALSGAAPAAPTLSTTIGRPATTKLTISWSAPTVTNGASVTNYKLYNGNSLVATYDVKTNGRSYTFESLTMGSTYTLGVSAVNSLGESIKATVDVLAGTVSSAPTVSQTVTRPTSTSITVTWTAPVSANGSPVTGYKLYNGASLVESVDKTVLTYTFRSLITGRTYALNVTAINAIGESSDGKVSALAGAAPNPPIISPTVGQVSPTQISISWNPPNATNGANVINYKVYNGTAVAATLAANVRSYTFTSLITGRTYTLGVMAVNSIGDSNTATVTALAATAPAAPVISTTVTRPSTTAITISWTAGSNNGAEITNYRVYNGKVLSATLSGSDLTYTYNPLTSGSTYNFSIIAVNAIGVSPSSNITATAGAVPPAPLLSPNVTRISTTSLTINWKAPTVDGPAIISYKVYNGINMMANVNPSILSYTFVSLTMGTSYTFSVSAVNIIGEGSRSRVSALSATVPSAPTLSTQQGRPTNSSHTISWTAATANGVSVLQYNMYVGSKIVGRVDKSVTTYTFTNLTTGSYYDLGVSAVNEIGEGTSSKLTAIIGTGPSAPVLSTVIGRPAPSKLNISWSAPQLTNGAVVNAYKVYLGSTLVTTLSAKSNYYCYESLTVGSTFRLAVSATNSIGEGDAASVTTIAATAPSSPSTPYKLVRPSGTELTVSFNTPDHNGAAITSFILYRDSIEDGKVDVKNTSYTFKQLNMGTTYLLSVSAINKIGESVKSQTLSALAAFTPGSPVVDRKVKNPTATSITMTWNAPSAFGSPITNYKLYLNDKEVGSVSNMFLNYTFTSLTPGTTYNLAVAAVNGIGTGSRSTISALAAVPPDAPSISTTVRRPSSSDVTISWTAPTFNGGANITNYKLYQNGTEIGMINGNATSFTFTALTTGSSYVFAVAAINRQGEGNKGSMVTIAASVPAPPSITSEAHPIATTITITWAAGDSNGSPISSYKLFRDGTLVSTLPRPSQLTYSYVGLTAAKTYTLAVTAVNDIGESVVESVVSHAAVEVVPPCNYINQGNRTDCPGNDLSWNPTMSHTTCFETCNNNNTCKGVVLKTDKGSSVGCWLKRVEGNSTTNSTRRCFNRITAGPIVPRFSLSRPDSTQVIFNWTEPTAPGCSVTSYKLYKNFEVVATVNANKLNYRFYQLSPGETYEIGVAAVNPQGEGKKASRLVVADIDNSGSLVPEFNDTEWTFSKANSSQHATPSGATWSQGYSPRQGIFTLNGINQYIDLGAVSYLGGPKSWTIAMWVRVDTNLGTDQAFARFFEFSSGRRGVNSIVLARDTTSNGITFRINNGQTYAPSYAVVGNVIQPNQWMHIAIVQQIDATCGFLDRADLNLRAQTVSADGTNPWVNTRSRMWNIENQRKICEGRGLCYNEYSPGAVCYSHNKALNEYTLLSRNLTEAQPIMANTIFYKNGIQVLSQSMLVPIFVTRTMNYIGKSTFVGDKYLKGSVDSLTIWPSTALSATQIGQDFMSGIQESLNPMEPVILTKYSRTTAGGATVTNTTVMQYFTEGVVITKSVLVQSTDASLQRKLTQDNKSKAAGLL